MQNVITDDLDALLDIFPARIRDPLRQQDDVSYLVEVVVDLGRAPEARFPDRQIILDAEEVTLSDIEYVVSRIGQFNDDNRAGIERTLHRISAMRNRQGRIVGLTCRVGRAVFGTTKIIKDIVEAGKSILLLGRPGVGKTTMLREVARVLADNLNRRVVVVDTSNEIAGDGDIPHPGIGHARRMQVPTPARQHAVMIEAVENHTPEVIIIDEIGTELEAQAARTIAERGVQLVATAHGNALENLIINPTLSDLIGGVESVTLGDEEAKRRGTQKTILERRSPPTFDIIVEIQGRERVAIHPDVAQAVDAILFGEPLAPETRWVDESGEVCIEKAQQAAALPREEKYERERIAPAPRGNGKVEGKPRRLYLFGINRGRVEQVAHDIQATVDIVNDLDQADMLVTSKIHYRRRPQPVKTAEAANMPIYVLRSSTTSQIRRFLSTVLQLGKPIEEMEPDDSVKGALDEAIEAVNKIKEGNLEVELSPQGSYIRRLQHLVAERNDMYSQSSGREPNRCVKIFRKEEH